MRHRRMFGTIIPVLIVLLALAVAGCGGGASSGAANELDLESTTFGQSSVTISSGQALHIVDSADSGGTHDLCIGQNGTCESNPSGPSELAGPGMMISPGTTKDITFSTAGTYHITCTIHPNMNVTITVN